MTISGFFIYKYYIMMTWWATISVTVVFVAMKKLMK